MRLHHIWDFFEWLGQKISDFLSLIEPTVISGILIFWAVGIYAMSKTSAFTQYGLAAVVGWSFWCMFMYMIAWQFRVDMGLVED